MRTKTRASIYWSPTRVEGWDYTFPAAPAGAIPSKVFATDHSLHLNDTNIALEYYPPAHTDSDISVNFTDADIVHVGDTWWNGVYPFIDYSTGGSIDGAIRAAEANLAVVGTNTIVIPGHGNIGRQGRSHRVPRHARRDPGERIQVEKARPVARTRQ